MEDWRRRAAYDLPGLPVAGTLFPFAAVMGSGPSQPLMGVARQNRAPFGTQALATTVLNFVFNFPYLISGGDISSFIAAFNNFYFHLSGSPGGGLGGEFNTGNAVVLDFVSAWQGSATIPVTFSGGRSLTLADGDVKILADEVTIAAAGFNGAKGQTIWIKGTGHVTIAAQLIPVCRPRTEVAGVQAAMFDPAATTLSTTDAVGNYTVTGTALTNMQNGFHPILLGRFTVASGSPKSYLGIADSHGEGSIIAPSGSGTYGFVGNALIDSDGASNPRPYMQFGAEGVPYAGFTTVNSPSQKWANYIVNANVGISEQGGNFSALSNFTSTWTKFYAGGVPGAPGAGGVNKLLVINIGPSSASSDSWATTVNQSQPPSVQPNPSKATQRAAVLVDFNAGNLFDYYSDMVPFRANPNTDNLIAVSGAANYATSDGLHMTTAFNGLTGLTTIDLRDTISVIENDGPVLYNATVGTITNTSGVPIVSCKQGSGTLYYVVVAQNDPRPTVTQIKAGQNSAGSAAIASGNQAVSSTGAQTFAAVTGLTGGTTYDVWYAQTNGASVNSTAIQAEFTPNSITNVQYGPDSSGTGATVTMTLTAPAAAGNLLVVSGTIFSQAKTLGITDDKSGTWTQAPYNPYTPAGGSSRNYIWWRVATGGEQVITITPSSSGTIVDVQGAEYHALLGTWTAEGTWTSNFNASSTNPDPGNITPTAGVAAVVIGVVTISGATPAAAAGYTKQITGTHTLIYAFEDRIVPNTSGAYDPKWVASSAGWAAIGAILSCK